METTGATFAPSVNVVVCTRERPLALQACLASLARIRYPNLVLTVVDNSPGDKRVEDIARGAGAAYFREPHVGINRARNTGLRSSESEIVAFIDDDAVADPDWVGELAREFADPAVGVVTGRIIAGTPLVKADSDVASMADFDCGEARRVVDHSIADWFEIANFGGAGAGANMAYRRELVSAWNGFDERIGFGTPLPGFGDHNAFFRVIDAGFRLIYSPAAIVYHPAPKTPEDARARRLRNVTAAVAYMLLLYRDYPPHRVRIRRYLLGALRARRRDWRPPVPSPDGLPRWRKILAACSGPLTYVRTLAHGRESPPNSR